jgi:hypothetical protein
MPCRTIGNAIVCSRGQRMPACSEPGCSWRGELLCDYPLAGAKAGSTCDRPICRKHAKLVGPNQHYCPSHVRTAA